MKEMKKCSIGIVLLGVGILFAPVFCVPAQAQKVIEWRMLVSWMAEDTSVKKGIVPFITRVNQRAAGKLKIPPSVRKQFPPFSN